MLYTSSVSLFEKTDRELNPIYVVEGRGNDVVVPYQKDLQQYREGLLTWEGFKVNYLAKLMKAEATDRMKSIAYEAVNEDVVLVSEEENDKCYRVFLAEMIMNMFSGQIDIVYSGELDSET
jgi:uncharacterized protein (DUF488 family)